MGDSARFRGCAAELNVFLEKKVSELESQLQLSESMYRLTLRERNHEREISNLLAESIKELLSLTSGQQSYAFMEPAKKRAESVLSLIGMHNA